MTMLDTLFGLIPAASRGQQWLAEDLQLVNWGGYDGAHRVRFSPTATLLCGGSGSGKSTLMDAYIALMMPHTTPFNGASNGGVLGRPRGSEQRNIISYGRGKLDESRTEDGTKMRVLRGDGCDTWTAVAMTWVDRDLTRFTAVRAWYIPATARILDDTVRVRATIDGPFDLRELEEAAVQHLGDAAVRAAGLATLGTDREFSAKLHATLGIGASGAGSKAMSLLARIQAGQQITTVDELYKRMVLEEPETLATADAVVEHFDELEGTRRRMVTARQQVHALEPIRDLKTKMASAANRLRLIDEVGRFGDSDSLAALWQASRRLELLREVEAESRDRKRAADELIREAETRATAAQVEHDGLAEVLRTSGGDRLETAQRELRGVETRLVRVQRDLDRLHDAVEVVQADRPKSATQYAALLQRAEDSLADTDAKASGPGRLRCGRAEQQAIEQEVAVLEADRCQAERRRGNIPTELDTSRNQLAAAAGLDPEELPFVGELVEVRTEFEPWREAFNLALGGFATTVLIDTGRLADFRSAIDSVRTPVRDPLRGCTHRAVRGQTLWTTGRCRAGSTSASPFTGWLEDRLEKRFGFVCVDEAAELAQHPMAVTIAGQISHGNRGEHGGHGRKERARLLESTLSVRPRRPDRPRPAPTSGRDRRPHARRWPSSTHSRSAPSLSARSATSAGSRSISMASRPNATVGRRSSTEVTAGNPEIARLRAQIAKARDTVDPLQQKIGRAKQQSEQADEQWAAIMDQVDLAEDILQTAHDAGRVLTAEQQDYLDACFDLVGPGPSGKPSVELARFDTALETALQRLAADQATAQESLGEQRENLARTLNAFLERWPNPNLLADPDRSVGDFERILADLEASGLHELETEWRNSLLKLSGNDLTNLDSTLGRSLREIRDRIEPINLIMQDLPFYDDASSLADHHPGGSVASAAALPQGVARRALVDRGRRSRWRPREGLRANGPAHQQDASYRSGFCRVDRRAQSRAGQRRAHRRG